MYILELKNSSVALSALAFLEIWWWFDKIFVWYHFFKTVVPRQKVHRPLLFFFTGIVEETIVALCPELALNAWNVGYFLDIPSKRINKSFDISLIISQILLSN